MRTGIVKRLTLVATIAVLFSHSVTLVAQEMRPALTSSSAKIILSGCEEFARKHHLQVAIAVLDQGKNLVAFLRMDRTVPGAGDIALWKATSSALFGASTQEFEAFAKNNPTISMAPHIAALEGGEPIYTLNGFLIGGIGVSGAASADDAACARAGIAAAKLTHVNSEDDLS